MPFKEGDFILIEYTARLKDSDVVIDTTSEKIAKEHGIYDEESTYEPMLIIIGERRVVAGLEEALKNFEVGEEKNVEVPPEKAYGKRDTSKIKRVSRREFIKANIEPIPGKIVEINGKQAIIRDVSGGRVTVDFNHPLAGKTIVYDVKVIAKLESDEEKIKALIKRSLKPKDESTYPFKIDKEKGIVEIRIPESEMLNPNIQIAKRILARDILKYIDGVNKVVFIEEIEKKEKKE